jgi:hypothetical protein
MLLAHDMHCSLDPIHLLREDPRIRLADSASKTPDTDNWSIDYATFKSFHDHFQFEIISLRTSLTNALRSLPPYFLMNLAGL